MPKHFARKSYASSRKSSKMGFRRTVKKPYGDRYGNDAFVKCENIEPLSTQVAVENVFSTMRVNTPVVGPGNTYLGDNAEFLAFQPLYARYEVRGMKAEITLNPRVTWQAANVSAGLAPRLANPALFPSVDNNLTYPVQRDCNVQGEKTTIYYAFSKDLKNSGEPFALSSQNVWNDAQQGIVQFRGRAVGLAANTVCGSIKMTWYVRFHGRTRPAGAAIVQKSVLQQPQKVAPQQVEEESMLSYAELQAQLLAMRA